MSSRFTISISLMLFTSLWAAGQGHAKFFVLDAGTNFIATEKAEKSYIRGDTPDFYTSETLSRRIQSEMYNVFVGAKVEVRSSNNRFGLLTGLRFTQLNSSLRKNGLPDYFYFLLRQTGTTTEYLRVERISQESNYLGIPVEVRFFPYGQKTFRLYIVGGTEVSYSLRTKTKAVFDNQDMDIYQSDVKEIVGKPGRWCSRFYVGAGFQIGKEKPRVSFGIMAPILQTDNASSLTTGVAGGGVHIQVQVPF